MQEELQKKIFDAGPILYGSRVSGGGKEYNWVLQCPDDLFHVLLKLTMQLEDFNRKHPSRYIRALKVSMEDGRLVFMTQRQVPCVRKWIGYASQEIYRKRRILKSEFLKRARQIHSTALFASRLLPDWKRQMPDDLSTLRKIMYYAERCACNKGDWLNLSQWYICLLHDKEEAERCKNISETE